MAAIGTGWAETAWIEAGWVTGAWEAAAAEELPTPPKEFPGGSRGGDITKLIMDKEKLREDRIDADDENVLSIIVLAIEEGIIE